MNRTQMDSFIKNMYETGLKDGTEIGDNTDFRIKLSKVLNETPGIGIKLYDSVMAKAKELE